MGKQSKQFSEPGETVIVGLIQQRVVLQALGRFDRIHGDEHLGAEFTDAELTAARNDLADDVLRGATVGTRNHRLADVLEAQSDPETLSTLFLSLRNAPNADAVTAVRSAIGDTLEMWARNYFEGSEEVAEWAVWIRERA